VVADSTPIDASPTGAPAIARVLAVQRQRVLAARGRHGAHGYGLDHARVREVCVTGVISLFVVLLVWRFFIVVGETVFAAAGLPPKAAGFEARSALVGAGYTTSQSEFVVRDPAARRVASTLVLFGYFGPTVIVALLGISFVLPSGEDLTTRGVTLFVLIGGLIVFDRLGVIRALGARPGRAVARRLIDNDTFETWIAVGDHVIAAVLIPNDPERAAQMTAVLNDSGVRILAIESAARGQQTFSDEAQPIAPQPGDRVVAFGPEQAFASVRNGAG
jgi:hypothetical protein